MMKNKLFVFLLAAAFLIALPLFAQQFGQGWVRIMALALLYVLLALGLNIVVGYAGLLDLGFVDSALVALTETTGVKRIATADRRHFEPLARAFDLTLVPTPPEAEARQ